MQNTKTPWIQLIKQVTPDYWLILLLVFLMKTGQFMLLPYLAIVLTKTTHASMDLIGFVVGAGPLVYGLIAPFGGYLIDRVGRRAILILSLFLAGVIFTIFNAHKTIPYYILMNILVGITRSAFDTATRSYKVHTMSAELKKFCFSLRFAVLNAGAGLGPVISLFFIEKNSNFLFIVSGIAYIFLALFVWLKAKSINDFNESLRPPSILQVFKVMGLDLRLTCIVIAGVLLWTCYSQLDSIFGIYVMRVFPEGVKVLTWTFVLNTVCCVLLQVPMSRVMMYFQERSQIFLGTLFYMAGFLLIPFMFHVSGLLFACFVVVLGEIILSPLLDLLVFKLAPSNMISSYYGASSIGMLGVGIGPMLGGFFYEHSSAKALFLTCVGLFVIMGFLLNFSAKEKSNV